MKQYTYTAECYDEVSWCVFLGVLWCNNKPSNLVNERLDPAQPNHTSSSQQWFLIKYFFRAKSFLLSICFYMQRMTSYVIKIETDFLNLRNKYIHTQVLAKKQAVVISLIVKYFSQRQQCNKPFMENLIKGFKGISIFIKKEENTLTSGFMPRSKVPRHQLHQRKQKSRDTYMVQFGSVLLEFNIFRCRQLMIFLRRPIFI